MSSLLKIVFSLGVTLLVSYFISSIISDEKFWFIFGLATIVQIFIFYLFNQMYSNKLIKEFELVRTDQIKEANRNFLVVGCPCDENNKQTIDFRFDSDNVFECVKCGKNFRVTSKLATLLTTDPIYFEK